MIYEQVETLGILLKYCHGVGWYLHYFQDINGQAKTLALMECHIIRPKLVRINPKLMNVDSHVKN